MENHTWPMTILLGLDQIQTQALAPQDLIQPLDLHALRQSARGFLSVSLA
jgi:hypothetical protein